MKKNRLDKKLVSLGLAQSRERARGMIMSGNVLVNRLPADKPGTLVSEDAHIEYKGEEIPYVSRAGLKLEAALREFQFSVRGLDCIDIGASTGGFTDCLLQHGAKKVFAVDVGYGQLAWKLRQDSRVIAIERSNIRYLPDSALPYPVDLAAIDVSFISLRTVVPAALRFLKKPFVVFALVKPQFEVGKGMVGKGGIVRNPLQREAVIHDLTVYFATLDLTCLNIVPSPIPGAKGNRELMMYLRGG